MSFSDSSAWQLIELSKITKHPILIITQHNRELQTLEKTLRFFEPTTTILTFRDWETLIYDRIAPSRDIVQQRLMSLAQLKQLSRGIVITTLTAFSQYLSPKKYIHKYCLQFHKDQTVDLTQLELQLAHSGYQRVSHVKLMGEFSMRGSSIDIFPINSHRPFRLDTNINQIDNIWYFDPASQLIQEACDIISIIPSREFPLSPDSLALFQEKALTLFGTQFKQTALYQQLSSTSYPAGIEYYLPLFFENTETLLDYLPDNTHWMSIDNLFPLSEALWQQIQHRYTQYRFNPSWPILAPEILYQAPHLLKQHLATLKTIDVSLPQKSLASVEQNSVNLEIEPLSTATSIQSNGSDQFMEAFKRWIESLLSNPSTKILFCIEHPSQQETLLQFLATLNLFPKISNTWKMFVNSTEPLQISVTSIRQGFIIKHNNLIVLPYSDFSYLMNLKASKTHLPQSTALSAQINSFNDLTQLRPQSPVVHIDHGIGLYLGLEVLTVGDNPAEFIVLSYANETKLYVPITEVHQLSPYHGSRNPPLNNLSSDQWQKTKNKAMTQLRDTAAELLDIYARKAQSKGCSFTIPNKEYQQFANSFPFEETTDQKKAIEEVIADLCREQPMDRVICGDVGFGKTEVAIRAAFLAAQSQKQVAVLAPTTLLVEQHYRNFRNRFVDWPITVDWLSRFRSHQENQKVKKSLVKGNIDIIIGTHALLSKTIEFKNLGLLIIDEEHHFGVQQKEQLLKLKTQINILTLTATPIPRTLQSALSGLRELSIIATPPAGRLAVKNFITPRTAGLIREAILRELLRGGQIYFVHNRVEHLERINREITKLVPEARILVAHGQLKAQELQECMALFYQQQYNLLICTSIVETGLDIPNANTLIVDRADHFGLAQLHQLKGRVGRSHHQAYAYFLVPDEKLLTPSAKRRLEALRSLTHLGSGFSLASHDLDIRGAGELLGDKQSGLIQGIGFSLYMELLQQTIDNMQHDESHVARLSSEQDITVELHIPILIPEDYMPDVSIRLQYYKRIAKTKSAQALKAIQSELTDQYGQLPQPTQHLFAVTQLKCIIRKLGIQVLKATTQGGWCEFMPNPSVNPVTIINMMQAQPHLFKLTHNTNNQNQKLHFTWPALLQPEALIDSIQMLLKRLSVQSTDA